MKIVFFDGYCNLCNGFVDWLVRRDSQGQLKFASLQGETAKEKLDASLVSEGSDVNTMVYLRENDLYQKSTAVLFIVGDLGGFWRLAKMLFIFPRFLRDLIYDFVAKHRYKIFGKRETCRLPTPEEKARFLP